ncbi:DNA adenine methylase [Chloroflexus islandicus]|uniref:Site-specific DNA-methyltransferase (adenine-specific) n=1 Tax=Chloroflexus islandicus TaxID=1707952 RepID=A0A178MDI9_9CHLR|nr:Dam family site-specific DNA-(adenine-N6)-methyltransferase [Chloroflexus islandicus]OAN46842.1 DNA adenine methylase [Chloroflexus islandicus]
MRIFVPPIKCQGIKTKLVAWIASYVHVTDQTQWIEPFIGSGVVGFNVRPKRAIFADINPHIINFYNAIKSQDITPAIARAFLEQEGALLATKGAEHFYEIRSRFNRFGDPLDFLFLSRSSFNGVIRFNQKGEYNVPFGHKTERFTKAYITKIVNQIRYVANAMQQFDWQFVCADFRSTIPTATQNDVIYCDPPYIGRHTDYFNSWTEHDEQDLYQLLVQTPARFILSTWYGNKYRTNAMIKRYQALFDVYTKEHFYHVGASERNRNSMIEALVLNYRPLSLVQDPAPTGAQQLGLTEFTLDQ